MSEDRHNPVRNTRRRPRRRRRRYLGAGIVTLAAAALVTGVVACSLPTEEPPELQLPTPVVAIPIESLEPTELQVWEEDPYESEKIEQALVEQGYFRDDVPLSYEDQDFLHTACQESGVPYALALAVIERETQFQNLVGDDGASLGYMQVQERWHWDRMERLGVTDLMNPFGNFRVGCDFLAELLEKYPTQEALTAYNSGSPGYNQYSYDVMANYLSAWCNDLDAELESMAADFVKYELPYLI